MKVAFCSLAFFFIASCSAGFSVTLPPGKPSGRTFQYVKLDYKTGNRLSFTVFEGVERKADAFTPQDAFVFNETFLTTAQDTNRFRVLKQDAPVPPEGAYKIEIILANHFVAPGYAGFAEFFYAVFDNSGKKLFSERLLLAAVHGAPSSNNFLGQGSSWVKEKLLISGIRRILIATLSASLGEPVPPLPENDGQRVTYCKSAADCLRLLPTTMVASKCVMVYPSGQCGQTLTRTVSDIKWMKAYARHPSLPDWAGELMTESLPQAEKPGEPAEKTTGDPAKKP